MRLTPHFLLSATAPAHFPDEKKTGGAPEAAFLGRSNVGKSSLLNALLGAKLAHTSSTPGRTRAINFFGLYPPEKPLPKLVFADLPGYGYAKISRSVSAEWPKFIEPYLLEREPLRLAICLVDTNILPQESDTVLIRFLMETGRPFVVAGTKADRVSGNLLAKSLANLRKAHGIEEVVPVSSKTSAGVKELWSRVAAATDRQS